MIESFSKEKKRTAKDQNNLNAQYKSHTCSILTECPELKENLWPGASE